MSLSDFMPYGAPELLEGASPRMARATFAATGLVAAMVCCAGLIASQVHGPTPPIAPKVRVFDLKDFVLLPPPPDGAQAPPKVNVTNGDFHPVEYDTPVLPPIDHLAPESPASPAGGDGQDVIRVPTEGGGDAPPADPPVGSYVYTDELPQLVRSVKPIYPDLPREAGVEGTVKLWLLVGLDGHVLRAVVAPRGSVPMLDEAAIAAALQFRFTPALANQKPVKVWVAQDFKFSLH